MSAIRIVISSLLVLSIPTPAFSWWNLWNEQSPPPPIQPIILSQTTKIRESHCGISDKSIKQFGETLYMRGEKTNIVFSEKHRTILAAATISESLSKTKELLSPLIVNSNPDIQAAALITYIFWILKHREKSKITNAEISRLLDSQVLNGLSDKHYLKAVLALQERNWDTLLEQTNAAINISPLYYNAQVLSALDNLRRLSLTPISCSAAIRKIQKTLLPVLSQGACPTHVAHFDLAIERYTPSNNLTLAKRNQLLRRIILAYVARNKLTCNRLLKTLASGNFRQECKTVISSLKCD